MSSPLLINSGLTYVGHAYKNTDNATVLSKTFFISIIYPGGYRPEPVFIFPSNGKGTKFLYLVNQ